MEPVNNDNGKTAKATSSKASPSFPFLKLPPEVREIVYQYLVVPENTKSGQPQVLMANEILWRRDLKRVTNITDLFKVELAIQHLLLDSSAMAGIKLDVLPTAPTGIFLDIMSTCRAIYHEAQHIFYTKNVFAAIIDPSSYSVPFDQTFPSGWDMTRIRRLELSLQLDVATFEAHSHPSGIWSSLLRAKKLKTLRIGIVGTRGFEKVRDSGKGKFVLRTCVNLAAALPKAQGKIIWEASQAAVEMPVVYSKYFYCITKSRLQHVGVVADQQRGEDARKWLADAEDSCDS